MGEPIFPSPCEKILEIVVNYKLSMTLFTGHADQLQIKQLLLYLYNTLSLITVNLNGFA